MTYDRSSSSSPCFSTPRKKSEEGTNGVAVTVLVVQDELLS